jgi:uncharacterized ferritin-like protein (DUF455 family)
LRLLPPHPFRVAEKGIKPGRLRSLKTREGVTDRLRSTAFAELQAREGFLWAADRDWEASDSLRRAWRALAQAEDRHMGWLLRRLDELGAQADERSVSDFLWRSFEQCDSAQAFSIYMASAELWGKQAGEKFARDLEAVDPESAKVFHDIAREEVAHVRLAARFFPDAFEKEFGAELMRELGEYPEIDLATGATKAPVASSGRIEL